MRGPSRAVEYRHTVTWIRPFQKRELTSRQSPGREYLAFLKISKKASMPTTDWQDRRGWVGGKMDAVGGVHRIYWSWEPGKAFGFCK